MQLGQIETRANDASQSDVRTSVLSADELLHFAERGCLRVGRVLNDAQLEEVRGAAREARLAAEDVNLLDESQWMTGDGGVPQEPGRTVSFLFNLWRTKSVFQSLTMTPTFGLWSSQVLGARRVRVLEDNALTKDPLTGGELKWHQDYSYWPLGQPNAVTLWIALDDVTVENGAMQMAIGSHLMGERLPMVFGTGAAYFHDRRPFAVKPVVQPNEVGLDVEFMTMRAGEASLHHALTWHASGPNSTDFERRAAVVRYVADGTVWFGERRYDFNYSSEEVGLRVGEPLDGPFFPLVPERSVV